ncbi:octopressin receptor-like [Mytilus californianus]|uniref:octopressin receptor-like n=1 Tax=Mytilus californianus TaxID=6549 RepID=UPI002245C457|nr:octopressin receptor-like [Mytilus californianus]
MAHNLSEEFVEAWNTELKNNGTGNISILLLLSVCGIIGNAIVLVVYKCQMKDVSDERYFIPVLALADMIACVVCFVADIVFIMINMKYTGSIFCEVVQFLICNTQSMSIFLLMCIAVQRYFKICKKIKLSLQLRRMMIILSIIFSTAIALPLSWTSGPIVLTSEGYIIVEVCGRVKNDFNLNAAAYGIAFSAILLLVLVAFVFLYGRIGCTIYSSLRPNRFKRAFARLSRSLHIDKIKKYPTRQSQKEDGVGNNEELEPTLNQTKSNHPINRKLQKSVNDKTSITDFSTEDKVFQRLRNDFTERYHESHVSFNHGKGVTMREGREMRNKRVKNKFSVMFMIITSVFIVSYVPASIVLTLEGIFTGFWENLSLKQLIIILWVSRTYLINNFINPLIYAFMDAPFRNAAKTLFRTCLKVC